MIVSVDPNGHFKASGAKMDRLVEACGLLPLFAAQCYGEGLKDPEAFQKQMVSIYGFGDYRMDGTVDSEGVYNYPEDPPLHPLVALSYPENPIEVLIYQYAILAVKGPDETIISRMA